MGAAHTYALTVCALLLLLAPPAPAAMQTITTTYEYNGDGAPVAVTTQFDGGAVSTLYLTYDNYTPALGAPADGTVSMANGNLLGIGANPAGAPQFAYDARDRLNACARPGAAATSYAYHPNSFMASSTLASGDGLQFYYEDGLTAPMVNTRHAASGDTDSFLGPVRYLGDGTEQVLLGPRKDTAGVYDSAAESLTPYRYAPYGDDGAVSDDAPPSDEYDSTRNPFRYTGAYHDAACDAYYLRARWYLPQVQSFLSRDPVDALHRYSYTGGNPVGRADPSGLRFTGESVSRGVDHLVRRLTPGAWAYVEPVLPVWGQMLGGAELVGLLPSFWHHPTTQGWITFGFLSSSIADEAVGGLRASDRLFATPADAFRARLNSDVMLGVSQTFAQSYRHGRVDVPSLIEGSETTAAGMFWARGMAGIGYRPFGLTLEDADREVLNFHGDPAHAGEALVFRVRFNVPGSFTSPMMEHFGIGTYHEGVLAYTRDELWYADVNMHGRDYTWEVAWGRGRSFEAPSQYLAGRTSKELILAGSFRRDAVEDGFISEIPNHQRLWERNESGQVIEPMPDYSKLRNNCQQNAARVRANITGFHRLPPVVEDMDGNIQ